MKVRRVSLKTPVTTTQPVEPAPEPMIEIALEHLPAPSEWAPPIQTERAEPKTTQDDAKGKPALPPGSRFNLQRS